MLTYFHMCFRNGRGLSDLITMKDYLFKFCFKFQCNVIHLIQ
ncbi:hypothetical protein HanRHA438_Chr02g0080361 [Helianthus annuus]|nr:hypothetical protein HanRHA438_Chr02g0080361 [Helianthus annuus]